MKRSPLLRTTPDPSVTVKIPRLKTCAAPGCENSFRPFSSMIRWCSSDCAAALGLQALLKRDKVQSRESKRAAAEEKKVDRKKREAMKSRSQLQKEAQAAVNRFVRLRDADLPCISCQRHHQGSYDAGHYMSTGARPGLRFDLANIHKQCVPCNQHLHGNLVLMRQGLIQRIGQVEVDRLEGPDLSVKLTNDELRALRDDFRRKAKEMEKAND